MRSCAWGRGLVLALAAGAAIATPVASARTAVGSPYTLANRCFALRATATGRYVALAGSGRYSATAGRSGAIALYLKPTGLGTYMLYDSRRGLLATADRAVARTRTPGPPAQWRVARGPAVTFTLTSTADGRRLVAVARSGLLQLVPARSGGRGGLFRFVSDGGCQPFPEAQVGAFGPARSSVNSNGTVFGWADLELHVTASYRVGGDVISGEDFDPFGITVALSAARDRRVHGFDGSKDVVGNLLRSGSPFGSTDNHGWPTFVGWPAYNTYTHQQVYWVWLERAWRAGLRLITANTSEDGEQCRIEPMRAHSCNETASIELQVQNLRRMQNYIDAQFGGPGRGFFRLVYSPAQARRVIEQGKLAVVIGVESSNAFGCSEYRGQPRCTRADVDRGLALWWKLGIRTFFPVHWVDNAFAGAALEGGATGIFINILNRFQTGRYFQTARCPYPGEGVVVHTISPALLKVLASFFPAAKSIANEPMPAYPTGPQCNARGLTPLGRYLINQMIARHFIIQVDHLSEKARESVLAIAARAHYPLVSSHTDTGGTWVSQDLRRLCALGGLATITSDIAATEVKKILQLRRYRSRSFSFGVGFGTDTGGFAALPGPRPDAAQHPLRYPFKTYNGVAFVRERTGKKVFDINTDGVAQYGQFADLVGEMQQQPGARAAMPILFRSAEAYLDAWQRARLHR